jgi:histidyl-tRNA synthetase
VFQRTLGVGSDVVMKEMYAFKDLAGNDLALRPEGTAGRPNISFAIEFLLFS